MSIDRFLISALIIATASPALAVETAPVCPETVKAENLVTDATVTIETPLFPLSQLIPDSEIYCSETMKGDAIVRRWHERTVIEEKPARIDHYDNGIGIAWGPKSVADFPVLNRETNTQDFSSLDCRSWKSYSTGKPVLECTAFPAIADGTVKPVELSLKTMMYGGPEIKIMINPRAFYEGTYIAPDRETPLNLTYGETKERLYFISGAEGFSLAIFGGGKNELDEKSAKQLLEGLNTGPTATLSYTDSEGGTPSYTFTEADIMHARMTMALIQQLAEPIARLMTAKAGGKQTSP